MKFKAPWAALLPRGNKGDTHLIENSDITLEEDLDHLIRLMFGFPDRAFYLVSLASQGANQFVLSAEQHGVLKLVRTDRHYYPHPNFKRDYIKIDKENPDWDWEKEAKENAPEHIRCTMELTERWRRKLELSEALSETNQKESDESPFILKPGMFGIGIDLPKAAKWFKKKFGKSPNTAN